MGFWIYLFQILLWYGPDDSLFLPFSFLFWHYFAAMSSLR